MRHYEIIQASDEIVALASVIDKCSGGARGQRWVTENPFFIKIEITDEH